MKIAVYAIAKNEEHHVERFVSWAREADMVCVLDTGSDDGTYGALIGNNILAHQGVVKPWRFDVARNAALALVPADIDICVVADLDEVFEPSWRELVEQAWSPTTTRLTYPFVSSHTDSGAPATTFRRSLIHSRFGYIWKHPCHELLYAVQGFPEVYGTCEATCHHWQDGGKDRGSYLPMLEAAYAEEKSTRALYYLAREYSYKAMNEKAIATFKEYLKREDSWVCERAEAYRLLAGLVTGKEREQYLLQAVITDPSRRDQWVDLATYFRQVGNWSGGYYAATQALSLTNRMHPFMTYAEAWGHRPYDEGSLCAWYAGAFIQARKWLKEALRLAPEGQLPRLKANAKFMGVKVCR